MAACVQCNLCEDPGTLEGAAEAGEVPCNVREFRRDLFTLWRCTGCGSLHCAEDADLDRYYAHYPLKIQKLTFSERIGYRNRLRLIQAQGLSSCARILDYGCGAGLFVEFLREQGVENAAGYDPLCTQICEIPWRLEEQYDAVVSYDVIEHSDDPRAFLRSLVSLVRPGGLLVVGTPNAQNVSSPAARAIPPCMCPITGTSSRSELCWRSAKKPAASLRKCIKDRFTTASIRP